MSAADSNASRPEEPARPGPVLRALLSLLFGLHLLAIFIAPLTAEIMTSYRLFPDRAPQIEPRQPPRTWQEKFQRLYTGPSLQPWLQRVFQPYLDAAYLNHGYGFFAPDPGPSFVVDYTVERADGTKVEGRFPDLAEHWPRLRYHRHFMLTSQADFAPEDVVQKGYAQHLLEIHNGRRVTLQPYQHFLARREEVQEGLRLDAPQLYRPLDRIILEAGSDQLRREAPP